jgi:hypothetical protein
MLQVLAFTQKNIIATRVNDLMGINDYEKIHPLIHNIIDSGKKVRWYFEMDGGSISNAAGFWEDGLIEINYSKLNFTHSEDIEKIAIVGEQKWEQWMVSIMKPFTKAWIMYFSLADKEKAMEWIMNQDVVTES